MYCATFFQDTLGGLPADAADATTAAGGSWELPDETFAFALLFGFVSVSAE